MANKKLWIHILVNATIHIVASQKFVLIDTGDLFQFSETFDVRFFLDVADLRETALLLGKNIESLNKLCEAENKAQNCDLFLTFFKGKIDQMEVDLAFFQRTTRTKRTLMNETETSVEKLTNRVQFVEKELKALQSTIFVLQDLIIEIVKKGIQTESKIHELEDKIASLNEMSQVVHSSNILLDKFETHVNKLHLVMSDNFMQQFFRVIDLDDLKNEIVKSEAKLGGKRHFPQITTKLLPKISKITTQFNNSCVTITMKVPLIEGEPNKLYKFVPIPFQEHNKTYVLEQKPIYIYENNVNEYKLFQLNPSGDCIYFERYIFCEILLMNELEEMDKCVLS